MSPAATSEQFAALHLRYARVVAAVLAIPLCDALGDWTPAARLAGAAWHLLSPDPSPGELAEAYRRHRPDPPAVGHGCFRVDVAGNDVLRLHFVNDIGRGVLASAVLGERQAELHATLREGSERYPRCRLLRCGSWLYHLPAYRSLFPPGLLRAAGPSDTAEELTYLALWGQFLHGDGTLRAATVGEFEARLQHARQRTDLLRAFPLTKLNFLANLSDVRDSWSARPAR